MWIFLIFCNSYFLLVVNAQVCLWDLRAGPAFRISPTDAERKGEPLRKVVFPLLN